MKKRLLALVLILSLLLPGCSGTPGAPESSYDETEQERFLDFTEELFRRELSSNTVNLHYTLACPEEYGITDYEIQLPSSSRGDWEESASYTEEVLEELQGFDREALDEERRLTYDVLLDYRLRLL